MKRMLLAALAALAIAGAVSAQGVNPPPKADPQQAQQVTISGKLEWIDGTIGLKSGGVTYYAPQLRMLVGFVKDLQEGSTVTLTGYAHKLPYSPNSLFLTSKLGFNGKDYELGQGGFGPMGRGSGPMGRGMRMMGFDGDDRPENGMRGSRW
jgi:hypothetical protein